MPGLTTLVLENKKPSTWEPIIDDIQAILTFNPCCPEFTYEIEVHATPGIVEYSLVYYADQQGRFVNWGGDPLLEIFTFTTDTNGDYYGSGSVNLAQYFPVDGDWNIGPDAHYKATDSYEHAKGAKLWIVPTADISGIIANTIWNPDQYLFETDLVFYFDCSLELPSWFGEVYPIEDLDDIGSDYLIESKESVCLITQICLNWAAYPGQYTATTTVSPQS